MESSTLHRHYRLSGLNFRDFWDICSHYQKVHSRYRRVLYTVEGFGMTLCANEADVAKVLSIVAANPQQIRGFTARYYMSLNSEPGDYGNAKIVYMPETTDFLDAGLHFFSENDNKLQLYHFEDYIYNSYTVPEEIEAEVEYGLPCEILAAVIDMRGFSAFCEQPNIESPYTCGLMTAFYAMVRRGFKRYPPDMVKFLGDGVLAVWQTTSKDRQVAIEVCLEGLNRLPVTWRQIISGPEFSHGAPEHIGSGLSFGLASKLSIDQDYIGRPINLASRLCGLCPPARTYIDISVPGMSELGLRQSSVRVKSFGDQKIWLMEAGSY
ncbi:MAG: hypothetical protein LR015_14125 [Verrucomicrobia bacterium]|nr:hypothetical protein [Verrucomicrobiota bacterium]